MLSFILINIKDYNTFVKQIRDDFQNLLKYFAPSDSSNSNDSSFNTHFLYLSLNLNDLYALRVDTDSITLPFLNVKHCVRTNCLKLRLYLCQKLF